MQTQVMVPGILVALKTSVTGGVSYQHQSLEEDEAGKVKRWETTRLMDDPDERKKAAETCGKAANLVARLCVRTSFGLLCRTDREQELDEAVTQMRAMATEWNSKARYSFVNLSAIKGRIADNDEEAIRAILDEARDLLDRMDRGLAQADVKVIRDAAVRATRLSQMMTEDTSVTISKAIAAAREAATAIVKRSGDVADTLDETVIDVERSLFDRARFSFLDSATAVIETLPSVNLQRGASLEIDNPTTSTETVETESREAVNVL